MVMSVCRIGGCERPMFERGWCQRHYTRWYRHGDPLVTTAKTPRGEAQAFFAAMMLVERDECIDWPYRQWSGYGYLGRDGVHVLACIAEHGPCPEGKREVGHLCGRRICFNPRHVRWVTKSENEADTLIHGTHTRGSRNGGARLTDDQVVLIRCDPRPGTEIAGLLGVSKACISRVRLGQTYQRMGMAPWQ
jgi:hypothetical protein